MEQEKIITLDLTGCKYLGEIHQRIKKAFDFPDFYGENWDAFWDLLRTECDADKIVVGGEMCIRDSIYGILIFSVFAAKDDGDGIIDTSYPSGAFV